MKRIVWTWVLAASMVTSAFCGMTLPAKAAQLLQSRIVGDANNDGTFSIADLVRTKRHLDDNMDIQTVADLNWDGAITTADIVAIKNGLLNYTVQMELPEEDGVLAVASMTQEGSEVILTLKKSSEVWVTDEDSKVTFNKESGNEDITIGEFENDGTTACTIAVTDTDTTLSATIAAEYWSIPVK